MTNVPASEPLSHPVHSLQAFGGLLIGTDRGEWIGRLQFQDQDQAGGVRTILEKNVLGIVKNKDGVFVFTGLNHLSMNEGLVYVVKLDTNNIPRPELLIRLPGFPSQVRQKPDGTIEFIVFTGGRDQQGTFVHECFQLAGQVVSRGAGCQPLQPAGAND